MFFLHITSEEFKSAVDLCFKKIRARNRTEFGQDSQDCLFLDPPGMSESVSDLKIASERLL